MGLRMRAVHVALAIGGPSDGLDAQMIAETPHPGLGGQPFARIERLAAPPNLKVEDRPAERPRLSGRTDHITRPERVTDLNPDLVEVADHGEVLLTLVHDHELAVSAEPARIAHLAVGHSVHGLTELCGEVHALAKRLGAKLAVDDAAEALRQGRRHRCRQLAAQARERNLRSARRGFSGARAQTVERRLERL